MNIKIYLLVLLSLTLSSCYLKPENEIYIITDFGDYSSISSAHDCEANVDWYDGDTLDDSQCTRAFAALELREYIGKITSNNQPVRVLKPARSLPLTDSIIIADIEHLKAYEGYGIDEYIQQNELQLRPQGYVIRTIQDNDRRHVLIIGGDRAGALYGAYELLEVMGVRWYGPGAINEVIPAVANISLPIINKQDAPAFLTRGFWAKDDRGDSDFFNWMARNRINLWSYAQPERNALRKRAIKFLTGGHEVQQRFLNPDSEYPYRHEQFKRSENYEEAPYSEMPEFSGDTNKDGILSYSEAHPEWFGLINGKRNFDNRVKYGTNFCTSNHDAVHELGRNFINDLISGKWSEADMINIWPVDVGKWCECDRCSELGTETDRMIMLVHQIRNALNESISKGDLDRDIVLTLPAYLETRRAPSKKLPDSFDYKNNVVTFFPIERCYSHAMNDASCTDINHYHHKDMKSWLLNENRYYKGTMFIGEYYNVSFLASLPIMYTQIMASDIPYYYKSGIRHMHYMHVEVDNWGTMLPNNYLFSKMLWDPELDVNDFKNELYENLYGKNVHLQMTEFYRNLELAMSSMKTIRWAGKSFEDNYSLDQRLNADNPVLFTTPHLQLKPVASEYNDGRDIDQMLIDIKQARSYIDDALAVEKNSLYRKRLVEVEKRFSYGEAMLYFYKYLLNTHIEHHNGKHVAAQKAFIETAKYAQKLKQMKDVIGVVVGTLKSGDGFTATYNVDTYNRYKRIYGENVVND